MYTGRKMFPLDIWIFWVYNVLENTPLEVKIMTNKPVLVVMAAGMGSRYGGLKQIDPVGSQGEAILDFSLFDAHRAGFETAVIIIK